MEVGFEWPLNSGKTIEVSATGSVFPDFGSLHVAGLKIEFDFRDQLTMNEVNELSCDQEAIERHAIQLLSDSYDQERAS